MTRGPLDKTLLRISLLATACALAGCVGGDPFNPPIDRTSPSAARVAEVSALAGPYPRWSQFPAQPKDVPKLEDFASRAAAEQSVQSTVLTRAAGLTWTLSGTEAFAAAAHARIDPILATPAPADSEAAMRAWAQTERDLDTPPPPRPH